LDQVAASPSNWRQEDAVTAADKPFGIDKKRVYEAYKVVKANAGAAGVDGQTIAQFDADLKGNLYNLTVSLVIPISDGWESKKQNSCKRASCGLRFT
jgi:hypothetical protein